MPKIEELKEDDFCPECKQSKLKYVVENCSCHISAPCHQCTNAPLSCSHCGFEHAEELYNPPVIKNYNPPKYKTVQDRFDELPDGVFGCVKFPCDGWGMQVRGKMPSGMSRSEVLSKCGVCKHGCPHFTLFENGRFHFTYTYN